MSELFSPVHGVNQIEYDPQPRVYSHKKDVVRVYSDKAVTVTAEYVTYDKGANIKTITNTSKMIDILI